MISEKANADADEGARAHPRSRQRDEADDEGRRDEQGVAADDERRQRPRHQTGQRSGDDDGADEQLVGQRVQKRAGERRLAGESPRNPTVQLPGPITIRSALGRNIRS